MKFFCFFFLLAQVALGQQVIDTASRLLDEVSVMGTSWQKYAAGSRTTTIDSTIVAAYKTAALSEVLQLQMPVYFRNYGQGQLNSISLRGTSSNHTAVIWNGLPVNSPTFGSSDFSILPAFGYNQVAIQHGNSAAQWGTGAIGGSILIGSAPVFGKGLKVGLQTEISRFGKGDVSFSHLGYYASQAGVAFSSQRFHTSTSVWQNYAENNFPYRNFTLFGNPEVRQENALFRQKGISQNLDWKFVKNGLISVRLLYTNTYRQVQPAMTEGNNYNYRIDDTFRGLISGQLRHKLGETSLKLAYFNESLNYNGENSPVKTLQTQLQHETEFSEQFSLKAGGDFQHPHANIAGNYSHAENRASVFLMTYYQPLSQLEFSLNLRQAFVSGYTVPFTPHFGINWQFLKVQHQQLGFKTNLGKGYRVPTLHDRYWIGGGNPLIRPENSFGFETGLVHQYSKRKFLVATQLNYYHTLVKDWIQWVPTGSQEIWSPRNVLSVRTQGLEFTSDIAVTLKSTKIKTGIRYYLNKSVYVKSETASNIGKQLEYTPVHTFLLNMQIEHKKWFGMASLPFTGERWFFGYNKKMDDYLLGNMLIGRNQKVGKVQVQLTLKCNNFFNTKYQTYQYYAMPGRNYSLALKAAI